MRTWRQCAEDYLKELWCAVDRQFVKDFSGEITCENLHRLCCQYSVARTIPGRIEELGLEKYKPFVELLNKHRGATVSHTNVSNIVEDEAAALRRAYKTKTPWSALTKALWMMKQHPVVIYDNYAWHGLRRNGFAPGYDGYREYFNAWFAFFDRVETQRALDDACTWLPESPVVQELLKTGRIDPPELTSLAASQSFRNRVTDMRLCSEGGADWFGSPNKCQ